MVKNPKDSSNIFSKRQYKWGENMGKKKSAYAVIGHGEIIFTRLSPKRVQEFQEEEQDFLYFGPFRNVKEARIEIVKYLIRHARHWRSEESEKLVPFVFEKVTKWGENMQQPLSKNVIANNLEKEDN